MTTSPVGERWSRSGSVLAGERQDARGRGVRPGRMEVAGAGGGEHALVAAVRGHRPDARRALARARERDPCARAATRRAGRRARRRSSAARASRRSWSRPRCRCCPLRARREREPRAVRARRPGRARRRRAGRAGSARRSSRSRPRGRRSPSRSVAKTTRVPSGSQAGSTSRPAPPARSCFDVPSAFMSADVELVAGAARQAMARAVGRPGGAAVRDGRRVGQPPQRVRRDLEGVDVAAAHERDRAAVRRPGGLRGVLGQDDPDPRRGREERKPSLGGRRRSSASSPAGDESAAGCGVPTPTTSRPPGQRPRQLRDPSSMADPQVSRTRPREAARRPTRRCDAPGRNRTYDLALRRRALYPLSYRRVGPSTLAAVELTHRTVVRAARRAVHDLARDARSTRRSSGSSSGRTASRASARPRRRSTTARASSPRRRSSTRRSALLGDDPFALEEIQARLAELPGRGRGEGGDRHGAPRPLRQARRPARVEAARPAARAGRRPRGRSGSAIPTTWRARAERVDPRFRRLKLKLGGRDGLDVERVRAVRSQTDLPLMVDVNEYWELDEAIENVAALAGLGVEYVEQPLPAGVAGRARAEGRREAPDLRGRGLPHARRRRRLRRARARDQHQAREVGRDPRGRQDGRRGQGARARRHARLHDRVRASASRPARRSRASATTSTSTGTSSSPHDPWPGVAFEDGVQIPADAPGLGVHEERI